MAVSAPEPSSPRAARERLGGALACARGPRAVEEGLLAEVEELAAAAEGDPRLLARPARVIVPSQSHRDQLCAALVRRAGRARLGVLVETLDALALEVLERTGAPVASRLTYTAAVREAARDEPVLARELGGLADGYAAVVASVDDFLDAGFTPAHAESVAERLAEVRGDDAALARAAALVRVSERIASEIASGAVGHRSAQLAEAAARIAESPDLLPSRAAWIHGFADATGVQADLLDVLVRRCGARVWLDAPPGPPGAPELRGAGFGSRLRERLGAGEGVAPASGGAPARLSSSRHAHPDAESRAAARWARERLDAGAVPERLAIVARDLGRYALPLRRHLRRLGVPFSGRGERAAAGPAARRLGALAELLEGEGGVAAERWLDAVERLRTATADRDGWRTPSGSARAGFLYTLHTLGIATLEDFAVHGGEEGIRVDHERVTAEEWDAWRRAARDTLRRLERAPERAPLERHAAGLRRLVALALGWDTRGGAATELAELLAPLSEAGARAVDREDFARVLSLSGAGRDALGGHGAGVQLLSVMEARGRGFDALWLLGLNRGVFPRRPSEDPLLPDALRQPLRDVLPDLPLKSAAAEEERFLFAQLVAAAPEVHLSCSRHDEGGRPAQASPLLDRIDAPEVETQEAADSRILHEQLLRTALEGTRDDFGRLLPHALAHGRRAAGLAVGDSGSLAQVRLAVLRELDPRDARRSGLGPYLGCVGEASGPADPRRVPPYVTRLEALARCPWQTFLTRFLRLAPPPDARGALPAATDARLLGSAVHAALARLADPRAGAPTRWPAEAAPEALLRESAEQTLREEGIALPGYARALARRVAPYVEAARRLAAADPAEVLAVEAEYEVAVRDQAGQQRALRFKPDVVERAVGGELRLSDYKTGRPPAGRRDVQRRLAAGQLLQAHAYALVEAGCTGRYLYLAPDLADEARALAAEVAQRATFEESVATLLEALDRGALPPRLRQPDRDEEPGACRRCEVKLACLRGDSGARLRLGAWAETGAARGAAERASLALWRLPQEGKR